MIRIKFIILLTILAKLVNAQVSLQTVLDSVAANNLQIRADNIQSRWAQFLC
jgi:hypothetical protein